MTTAPDLTPGLAELAAARSGLRHAVLAAFLFSALVNLLMLTAPLYMLQVYDRVLVSRSEETHLALTLLMGFLFLILGLVDHARGRIMGRVGARLQAVLDQRVLDAAFRRLALAPRDAAALAAQRDLDAVARFWASPVLLAIFDAPWALVFAAAIFVFHPWLGWLALAGALVIVALTWMNQRASDLPQRTASHSAQAAEREAEGLKAEAEMIQALGMGG
ncbi:MAG TPA: type I secretion system permease/ATPase, partial [Tabrizicola sp.]|nr:type I secretion system permease/ATPase [Tabrizicola sp.]